MRILSTVLNYVLPLVFRAIPLNYRKFGAKGVCVGYSLKNKNHECNAEVIAKNDVSRAHISPEIYQSTPQFMKVDPYDPVNGNISMRQDLLAWKLRNGRVYTNNLKEFYVMTGSNLIVEDASYKHFVGGSARRNSATNMRYRYFPVPKKYRGRTVSLILGGGASTNIGHWLMDALPRLHLIDEVYGLGTIDNFLLQGKDHGYRSQSLELLGINREKIQFLDERIIHIVADELVVTSHPRGILSNIFPKWGIEYLRTVYRGCDCRCSNELPAKIYISRKDSKLRGIDNEDSVVKFLSLKGFSEVVLSELSFCEKIALFRGAEKIVSMSGAALTFSIFCNAKAKVLEIFPAKFVHYVNAAICSQVGLNYKYIIAGNAQEESAWSAQRASISVDIRELEESLAGW